MSFWLQVLINGLLLGGFYSLSALAFSLEWGVMNIINLAHGSFVMLGAYFSWILFRRLGLDPFLSIPLDFVVFFGLGWLTQRVLINKILRASVFMTLLLTFGLDYALVNLALLIWKGDFRAVTPSYGGAGLHVAGVSVPYLRLGTLAVAILLSVALAFFMNRTRLGRAIMATSMDMDAASMMGVKLRDIYAFTFGIGTGLASIAGALYAATYAFTPNIGTAITLKAFVVTILGGLGNMYGPLLGGLLLGVVESVGTVLIGAGYVDVISFVILVLVLVLRPTGLAGRQEA